MILRKFATLLVAVLLLALYFWGHNIGEQPRLLANTFSLLIRAGADLLTVLLLFAAGGGIGYRVLPTIEHITPAGRAALSAGVGLAILSGAAVLIGIVGYFVAGLWLGLLLVLILFRRDARRWWFDLRGSFRAALRPQNGWERFALIFSGGLLLTALLLALAPPVAWDAMTYHLEGPHRYLADGAIRAHSDLHFLGFPQLIETLYGLVMAPFSSDSAPAVLHWGFGLLGLLAVADLLHRAAGRSAAYSGVLILLSSTSIWHLFGWPYVDLAALAYGAFGLLAIRQWRETDSIRWLIVAGFIGGAALGVKYTGGALLIALGVFVLVRQPRRIIQNGLILGGAALIAYAPWAIKGLLLYQNPIYPYFFGGLNWDALRTANFNAAAGSLLQTDLAWQWPLLPFTATIFGIEAYSPYAFTLGPLLLTLPLLLIVTRRPADSPVRSLVRDAALLGLTLLILWYVLAALSGIGQQPRLMLVGAPVATVLGALGLHSLRYWPRRPLDAAFILRGLTIFALLMGLPEIVRSFEHSAWLPYASGSIDRDGYEIANLGIYAEAMQRLEELPAGSEVLFMWEAKSYLCPDHITCIPDALYDHWYRPLMQGSSPNELMQSWRERGIVYLLVQGLEPDSNIGYDFWLDQHDYARAENAIFPSVLESETELVWQDGVAYGLYTWRNP